MSTAELVALHTAREYRAFFLGFMPGLAYCGMLDPRIDAPRLASPRPRIPPGTVAVAAGQTPVYPLDPPGGLGPIGRHEPPVFHPPPRPTPLIPPGHRIRL